MQALCIVVSSQKSPNITHLTFNCPGLYFASGTARTLVWSGMQSEPSIKETASLYSQTEPFQKCCACVSLAGLCVRPNRHQWVRGEGRLSARVHEHAREPQVPLPRRVPPHDQRQDLSRCGKLRSTPPVSLAGRTRSCDHRANSFVLYLQILTSVWRRTSSVEPTGCASTWEEVTSALTRRARPTTRGTRSQGKIFRDAQSQISCVFKCGHTF